MKQNIFATYGRFQPFTRAHEQMVNIAAQYAFERNAPFGVEPVIIGMSQAADQWKNPLSVEQRQKIIQNTLGSSFNYTFHTSKDPWTFLTDLCDPECTSGKTKPYQTLYLFCGDDQVEDYQRMADSYNNSTLFAFKKIQIVNCGQRDGDIGIEAISATKAREAVSNDDLLALSQILSPRLNEIQVMDVFKQIKLSRYKQTVG